jgi:flagellar hook assembly protein FlgD
MNPFSEMTTFTVKLLNSHNLRMEVFDVEGRFVRCLADGRFPVGQHRIDWDGRDHCGRRVPPGLYFCRMESGQVEITRKVVVVR